MYIYPSWGKKKKKPTSKIRVQPRQRQVTATEASECLEKLTEMTQCIQVKAVCYTCLKMRVEHPIPTNILDSVRFFFHKLSKQTTIHYSVIFTCVPGYVWWSVIGNVEQIPLRKSFVYSSIAEAEQLSIVQPNTRLTTSVGAPATVFQWISIQKAASYLFCVCGFFFCRFVSLKSTGSH